MFSVHSSLVNRLKQIIIIETKLQKQRIIVLQHLHVVYLIVFPDKNINIFFTAAAIAVVAANNLFIISWKPVLFISGMFFSALLIQLKRIFVSVELQTKYNEFNAN